MVTMTSVVTGSLTFSEYCYSGYTGCRGNRVKQTAVSMVPVIPLVAVVMAKVKFSLFAYSGDTDCSGNG